MQFTRPAGTFTCYIHISRVVLKGKKLSFCLHSVTFCSTCCVSIAEECQMDQNQMIIPIIVGAALAGLVLITLVAYLIGKRRSHAGYQAI